MAYDIIALASGQPGWVLSALALLAGALPDALALFQRRGFRRSPGFGRRRRRSGGLFGFLGTLIFVFLFGAVALLALGAYAVYRAIGRRRGR